MRGAGQIAELAAIAEPEVAVITNVGPVHVELLGSVEAIAAAKAEVLAALPAERHRGRPGRRRASSSRTSAQAPRLLRFGPGGDVEARREPGRGRRHRGADRRPRPAPALPLPLRRGAQPDQRPGRGRRRRRARRAARRDGRPRCEHRLLPLPGRAPRARRRDRPGERLLQRQPGVDARGARPPRHARRAARRIAVLGEMAELGPGAAGYHREVGDHARADGRRPADRRRRAGPRLRPRRAGRRPRRRRPSCSPPSSSPATRSWSRARARPASRPSPRPLGGAASDG